jgi:hypothetical protein
LEIDWIVNGWRDVADLVDLAVDGGDGDAEPGGSALASSGM